MRDGGSRAELEAQEAEPPPPPPHAATATIAIEASAMTLPSNFRPILRASVSGRNA